MFLRGIKEYVVIYTFDSNFFVLSQVVFTKEFDFMEYLQMVWHVPQRVIHVSVGVDHSSTEISPRSDAVGASLERKIFAYP